MRIAMIALISALLSSAVSAEPGRSSSGNRSNAQCQVKVNKCISLCLRQNPLNVCRRFCRRDLVCQLG
jgi:hypothetical protein